MVAKRDIHVNGIIAAENPVFIMPMVTGWQRNVSKEEMFVILFERLKLEQREQALALANCKPNGVCGVHEGILRINGLLIELIRFKTHVCFAFRPRLILYIVMQFRLVALANVPVIAPRDV